MSSAVSSDSSFDENPRRTQLQLDETTMATMSTEPELVGGVLIEERSELSSLFSGLRG